MGRQFDQDPKAAGYRHLRGGRFVKWQGKTASIAPFVGSCAATLMLGAFSIGEAGAAACTSQVKGVFVANDYVDLNAPACEIRAADVAPVIGNQFIQDVGFLVFSHGTSNTLTILEDITTTIKGRGGILSYDNDEGPSSTVDARGRTINLTLENIDSSLPAGDAISKQGVEVLNRSRVEVGTLNLTMLGLPAMYGHQGILAAGTAKFDNLDIRMSSAADGTVPLVGIRAYRNGDAAGHVEVTNRLKIDIQTGSHPAAGIHVSGPGSEVRLHDSDITVATTVTFASTDSVNAIHLGENGSGGQAGPGMLYSTGTMILDTTGTGGSAIRIERQGSILDANYDTSRTEIRARDAAIVVTGDPGADGSATITSFKDLIAETDWISLIYVSSPQQDYRLNVRGQDSRLHAETYLLSVIGNTGSKNNVTLNLSQGYMEGMTYRDGGPDSATHRAQVTNLTLNLSDGATWQLKPAGTTTTSLFTTLTLTDAHLIARHADSAPANFTLLAEAWDEASGSVIRGDVVNTRSTIDLANDLAGDVLTIDGNYTTGGGLWRMDAELTGTGLAADGGSTRSDTVTVTGNTLDSGNGADRIQVKNLAVADPTGLESYRLIQVNGTSDGKFVLDGRVVKGGYEYLLSQDANGSWYLASEVVSEPPPPESGEPAEPTNPTGPAEPGGGSEPSGTGGTGHSGTSVIRPEVGAYEANAVAAAAMFDHGWRDRSGAIRSTDRDRTLWLRLSGLHGSTESNHGQIGTDHERFALHFGSDLLRRKNDGNGEFVFGAMAGHGRQTAKATSSLTGFSADSRIDGQGLGVYGTWVQAPDTRRGWYVDGWVMLGRYDAKVRSVGFASQHYDIDSTTASIEAGHAIDMWHADGKRIWMEPQAQLIWSDIDGNTFSDHSGTRITLGGHSLTSRLGLRTSIDMPSHSPRGAAGFAQIDWLHAIRHPDLSLGSYQADFDATDALRVSLGYGQDVSRQARIDLRLDYTDASGGSDSIGANISLNYSF